MYLKFYEYEKEFRLIERVTSS